MKYAHVIDNQGISPLMWAADRGDVEIFRMIAEKIEESMHPIGLLSTIQLKRACKTMLMMACGTPTTETVRRDPNSTDLVSLMINSGFSPYTKDDKGRTALHHVVQSERRGIHETIMILLSSVPVNILSYLDMKVDNGMTPLHSACKTAKYVAAHSLLDIPDINTNVVCVEGGTPLHECVRRGW